MSIIALNRKAKFDYEILDSFQAGMSLSGGLVKLLRAGKIPLHSNYIVNQKGELFVIGFGNDTIRENVKLLLHKREIAEIIGKISEKGLSCTILHIKTVGRWIKAEIAVVRGKKVYDKRETIKKRDLDREEARNLA
jgi:SsrA-binding protein